MEEPQDNIGNLFLQAFEGHQVSPEREEWDVLQKTLQTRNFFKFNPMQFNIYYASSIIFCFLVCVGVGSHYTYTQWKKPATTHDRVLPSPAPTTYGPTGLPAVDVRDELGVHRPNPNHATSDDDKQTIGKGRGNGTSDEQMTEQPTAEDAHTSYSSKNEGTPNTLTAPDTVHVKPVTHHKTHKADTTTKPKRILYITKQDTIIQYDTLRAPRKKKKWF